MLIALFVSLLAADTPPTAAEVLDRFTAVTGGEAAYRAVKTQYVESTITLPKEAGKIRIQVWMTAQGETRSLMTSDGGSEQTGVYRGVAWSLDSEGPKILTGLKRAGELRDAVLFPHELWRDTFAKAEYLGSEVLRDGESCHKVRLTPKAPDLKPETYWFSAKTGLLVKEQNWDIDDETGTWREVMLWTSDYRKMPNGLLIPHRAAMELDGTQLKLTFDRMEFDRVFTDRELRYPPVVEKLVRKDAAGMPLQ